MSLFASRYVIPVCGLLLEIIARPACSCARCCLGDVLIAILIYRAALVPHLGEASILLRRLSVLSLIMVSHFLALMLQAHYGSKEQLLRHQA